MNKYVKIAPNVFVAQCEEEHKKGDIIKITTKYGKENEHVIHNLYQKKGDYYYYSITRADGFDSRERARNKVEKLESYADSAIARSNEYLKKADEGRDFLSLGEPIKVGHHSEKSHRALIDRNWNRLEKAVEESRKAESYKYRISYWEELSKKINLSMPESIDFYRQQLDEAIEYREGLKNGSIEREHSYSLVYANKRCNELKKKLEMAIALWG
jgi:signal peptidase I